MWDLHELDMYQGAKGVFGRDTLRRTHHMEVDNRPLEDRFPLQTGGFLVVHFQVSKSEGKGQVRGCF